MNRTFSKEHNEYFKTEFLVDIYDKYLAYCQRLDLIPDYLAYEFEELLKNEIPEEFVIKLLYHAELQGIDFKEYIIDIF